jgi:hypothetical protein
MQLDCATKLIVCTMVYQKGEEKFSSVQGGNGQGGGRVCTNRNILYTGDGCSFSRSQEERKGLFTEAFLPALPSF